MSHLHKSWLPLLSIWLSMYTSWRTMFKATIKKIITFTFRCTNVYLHLLLKTVPKKLYRSNWYILYIYRHLIIPFLLTSLWILAAWEGHLMSFNTLKIATMFHVIKPLTWSYFQCCYNNFFIKPLLAQLYTHLYWNGYRWSWKLYSINIHSYI